MSKYPVCTPCPICGCLGGVIKSKDARRQDGDKCVWPCGCEQTSINYSWVTTKRCYKKQAADAVRAYIAKRDAK